MVIFKKVRWKNFVATGDYFNEIDLNKSKSTLIVGKNGAGKSTLLDAMSFGLFGKPFRSTNKPELVNSINKKHTVVEVEFTVHNNDYKIVRAMKPAKFEIWKNGEKLDDSSHVRDHQKILENNILKLNHKSFHQIVVIGSSSFVPFMQLKLAQRREIIEDLLDIDIFTLMNAILRKRVSSAKETLRQNSTDITVIENEVGVQRKYIRDLEELNAKDLKVKQDRANELDEEKRIQEQHIKDTGKKILSKRFKTIDAMKGELTTASTTFKIKLSKQKDRIKEMKKELNFLENNETCPTCEQEISSDMTDKKKHECSSEAKIIKEAMMKMTKGIEKVDTKMGEIKKTEEELNSIKREYEIAVATIDRINNDISQNKRDIEKLSDNDNMLKSARLKLDELLSKKDEKTTLRLNMTEQQTYNLAMTEMLKDGGIKSKIIKQYIPIMNKIINQYLSALDFFVHFEFNQEFNESIKSRYRDNFTYGSFSEGEKQRIDLALLFTWRHIARMKESVATNLLILDETFDSSLDHDGTENLTQILDTLGEETNAFVISHKGPQLEDKFSNQIVFEKVKNFSRIKEVA